MVEFKNLALRDVTFVLCAQSVPLDEFNVLESRAFELDDQTRGHISIIGQSHVFQFSKGTDTLTEILLCVPHNLTAYTPICRTTALSNFRIGIESGGLKYATRISTRFVNSPDELLDLSRSFDQQSDALIFHFPKGHMPCAPVTAVEWQISNVGITVKSFHTFPDEQALVKTRTRIYWA